MTLIRQLNKGDIGPLDGMSRDELVKLVASLNHQRVQALKEATKLRKEVRDLRWRFGLFGRVEE